MNKFLIFFSFYTILTFSATAQVDTLHTVKEKMFDHYVGVQINSLMQQVFNFNNSASIINNNPYLLTYNINTHKSGWGLRLGIGYNFNSSTTNDGINQKTSNINDLQMRLGVEKSFCLTKNWIAGAGIDGIINTNNDKTTATTISSDTIITITKTVISSYGGGPMAWLRYNINNHILIGTETSFYYLSGNQKITINISNQFNGQTFSQPESSTNNKTATGTISIPVTFYLIIKF